MKTQVKEKKDKKLLTPSEKVEPQELTQSEGWKLTQELCPQLTDEEAKMAYEMGW